MAILSCNQTEKGKRLGNSIAVDGFTVCTCWHKPCSTVNLADTSFKLPLSGFNGFLLFVGRLDVGFKRHSEPPLVCDVIMDLTADQVHWSHHHLDPNKADDFRTARHALART